MGHLQDDFHAGSVMLFVYLIFNAKVMWLYFCKVSDQVLLLNFPFRQYIRKSLYFL